MGGYQTSKGADLNKRNVHNNEVKCMIFHIIIVHGLSITIHASWPAETKTFKVPQCNDKQAPLGLFLNPLQNGTNYRCVFEVWDCGCKKERYSTHSHMPVFTLSLKSNCFLFQRMVQDRRGDQRSFDYFNYTG